MRECWRTEPKERPTADEIHEALDALLSRRRVEHAAAPQGDAAPPALRQRVLPHVVVVRKNPKASVVTLDDVCAEWGCARTDLLSDLLTEAMLCLPMTRVSNLTIQ